MIGKLLNNFDKKYAFGLVTGLLFGLISLYTDYFRSNDPNIEFDILSNTTIVDLKEDIGKIDILYDSVSILSKKQTLSVVTLKVSNDGNADVLKNSYDDRFPLGLLVNNGKLLEYPTLMQSSDKYLDESIKMKQLNKNEIVFSNFIFEKSEFFVLKLLILHNDNVRPEIIAKGKVAGVKEIIVVKSYLNTETKSFWVRVFEGSFLIHTTRFFAYSIITLLGAILIAIIIIPFALIMDNISSKKRRKESEAFKVFIERELTEPEKFILDFYISNGLVPLIRLIEVSNNYDHHKMMFEAIDPKGDDENPEMPTMVLINRLKDKGYLIVQNREVVFKEKFKEFISDFIRFMRTRI